MNDLGNTGVVQATLDGQVTTGLTRPDYYNWPAELQADLPKYSPQVVVVMMGANDPQDFPGPPDTAYGTPSLERHSTPAGGRRSCQAPPATGPRSSGWACRP